MYEELVIWRRENGFDRVAEGEESCFHGHRSLPPTPQGYYASLWCEVNTLKAAILMLAEYTVTRPRQKDSLDELLANFDFARIKEYVERRSREAARAQVTAVTRDDTVQHCSPCSQTLGPPSVVYVNLENEERIELEELKLSSAGTVFETPEQQCPPTEGIWEQRRTTAYGFLTAAMDSKHEGRFLNTTERAKDTTTIADISSNVATPSKRRHKISSEEKNSSTPVGEKRRPPLWKAAVALLDFFAESGEASYLYFVLCTLCVLCFFVFLNYFFPQVITSQLEAKERDAGPGRGSSR